MELVNNGPPPNVITTTTKPGFRVAKNENVDVRPLASFHPSLWGDYFITNPSLLSTHQEPEEQMKQRVQVLVKNVKILIKDARGSMIEEMQLIDALQRLGVAYHFEQEINEVLCSINNNSSSHHPYSDDDLHFVALRFRLLRQHRYYVPPDVFNQFKDEKGKFKEEVSNDLKGMLSLYEAAYLGIPGEDELDEAINFTRSHLQSLMKHQGPRLAQKIEHALETPLRRRMSRLDARLYISVYEGDTEIRNDVVLELAKLDFHILQLLHREEAKRISIWWKDVGVPTKLTFARDRIVELCFWALGVYFEPQYSRARMMLVKVIAILSLMDDVYDSYGTMPELQHVTDAIQRWDLKAADEMENCLRIAFHAIYQTMGELEDEVLKDGNLYRIDYLRREFGKMAIVYLEEAKWRDECYLPSLAEHLELSLKTSAYHVVACATFLGIGEIAGKQSFDWVTRFPQIIKDVCKISRLMDDVGGYEIDVKMGRQHVVSTIHCCMNEFGDSLEEAKARLLHLVEDAWKDINKECLHLTIPSALLVRLVNLGCVMETIYRKVDGYTESSSLKNSISLLLVKPILC
ncbi:(-)-germacrene D synthase-like [Dioscorea cayenensis subsp. rotundata]|uniref:(-)-germacrene D synthase-like n=1 Tax=Dioscorea cayennensis subsp. rotundata TaxID=55577 RepID=A0AB40AJF6_DIOCR|nr:(-)-germacrene D synthase-like [Dioscorea cayenensis subsp. rotundata]